jgi:hypothetical protein
MKRSSLAIVSTAERERERESERVEKGTESLIPSRITKENPFSLSLSRMAGITYGTFLKNRCCCYYYYSV